MTIESTDLALGRGHICSRCGQPCRGSASSWQNGKTDWYCHPSDGDYPDCYHLTLVVEPLRGLYETFYGWPLTSDQNEAEQR